MADLVMADLQFSLPTPDGDYVFGRHGLDEVVVITGGWDTGSTGRRDQDKQPTGSDLVMVGRDYLAPPTWTFSLLVSRDGDVEAALERLFSAWMADSHRLTPGVVVPLRYARNGEQRVVYGRPREISLEPPDVWSDDYALVTAKFKLADATIYGPQQSVTLPMASPSLAEWIWGQFTWPIRPAYGVRQRAGVIDAGTAPVAFTATFTADPSRPTTGMTLAGDGWSLTLRDPLQPGHTVVVDTLAMSTTLDGQGASLLTIDSTLRARLIGRTEVTAHADQNTGAAVTVEWRSGARSI